jgi:hypothetical protein
VRLAVYVGGEQEASLAVQLPSTMMAVLKISRDVLSMFISLSRLHLPAEDIVSVACINGPTAYVMVCNGTP